MKLLLCRLWDWIRAPWTFFVDWFIFTMTKVMNSRDLLVAIMLFTIAWDLYNTFAPHPIDDARAGFPFTMFPYTVWFAWDAGIMKISQKDQQAKDDEIMSHLIQVLEDGKRRDQQMAQMLEDGRRRDVAMEKLMRGVYQLVGQVHDTLDIQEALQKIDEAQQEIKPLLTPVKPTDLPPCD